VVIVMTAQWLFEQIRKIDELIVGKKADREMLMDMATKITAGMDGMPHGSDVTDKVGNIAVKLATLSSDIDALEARRDKLMAVLESLPPDEYGALHRHYIRGMTWEEVAEDMNVSIATAYRYRKSGLAMLEQIEGV
jgi:DNA-directed RNA polymerase specialized sigma24 family protein